MIRENLEHLRTKIAAKASRCGRGKQNVRLVAVSKRFPATAIKEAQESGQHIFGENYIQEAQEKYDLLNGEADFHFIGHLQSNKAATAARICSMIETVDRIKLARSLNKHLISMGRQLDILIQVNVGRDDNKSGTLPEKSEELLREIGKLPMLRPRGLMTMPPFTEDPEDARIYFRRLKELGDTLCHHKLFFDNSAVELSMGMSHDYEVAIEEGATLVRIGTAIFGERPVR